MEEAHAMAQAGAPHGTTIVADEQTNGRGTRGRAWISAAGGLWLSVVARPSRTDALEALSLRVGLAVAAALESAIPALPRLGLKWPNDLVLDGAKLGGILCEARWGGGRCLWVVVGLGLNVINPLPPELPGVAARLAPWAPGMAPADLAAPLAAAVALAAREAGPLVRSELDAFALRDALAGRRVTTPIPGTAEGITAQGALRVRTDAGLVREVLGGVVTASS
jgi:BirA family biotin operon repressor/biotin-[acetyl-CoA-carboxylase] ligase